MSRGWIILTGLLLALPCLPTQANEKAAKEFLESHKATAGQLRLLADEAPGKAVPGRSFYALLFRQFPVGIAPPEGFSSSNVLAIDSAGKVTLIPTGKELEAYGKSFFLAKDDAQARLAVRAWLLLRSELAQDGFYKFQVVEESLRAQRIGDRVQGAGRVVVMGGGNGEISVQLTFDVSGKLLEIRETSKLLPGPRPICQASKLLDSDPLVRKICEADLLIMGKAALDYLMEQRARATPELQREIDRVRKRIEAGQR